MNQVLRLPVLKYTNRKKKKKKKVKNKTKTKKQNKTKNPKKTKQHHPPSPRKKEDNHNILDGAPYSNSQRIEPSTAVARTPTPEAVGVLDFLHFYVSAT